MPGLKPYRCLNPACADKPQSGPGHDFWAEAGVVVCPKCGKAQSDPKFGRLLVELRIVHFDPPTDVQGIGHNALACDPARLVGDRCHATGDPFAVNCPRCRETEAHKKALELGSGEVVAAEDFPVTFDPKRMVVTKG